MKTIRVTDEQAEAVCELIEKHIDGANETAEDRTIYVDNLDGKDRILFEVLCRIESDNDNFDQPKCKDCKYWDTTYEGGEEEMLGICRRKSPISKINIKAARKQLRIPEESNVEWPVTYGLDGCGDYEQMFSSPRFE